MKTFYSVELASHLSSAYCGTYEECIAFLTENGYKPQENGQTNCILKFHYDTGNEEHVMCASECKEAKLNDFDFEAVEIITDWSPDLSVEFNRLRDRAGGVTPLTQAKMAELAGIPLRTVEAWCTGKRTPPPYMLELVACKLRYAGRL